MIKKTFGSAILTIGLASAQTPSLQSLLEQGKTEQAVQQYAQPPGNQSTFIKALCQLSTTIETVQQDLYRFGFEVNSNSAGIRSFGPVPHNPKPEPVNYQKVRTTIETLHNNLHQIEETIAQIGSDEFHLPLDLTKVRFDVDKDGKRTKKESSIALFMNMRNDLTRSIITSQEPLNEIEKFDGTITFDKSDLIWLKGYIQIILGTTDTLLAHDFELAFNAISDNLFQNPENALTGMKLNEEGW